MTYSPRTYWNERGRTFEAEALERGWWEAEDPALLELLGRLTFASVLEVGCGFGRVGAAILARWPQVRYTGLDISSDLIDAARRRLPAAELICADLATFRSDRRWDLVLSVSVLGHLLPRDVPRVVAKLRRWAGNDLITIDWDEVGASTSYQFGHDYAALYGTAADKTPLGRLAMYHLAQP